MAEITIKNFKGMNLDESKWSEGYSGYTVGLDLFGLGNNSSKISYPGVLQGIFQLSAGSQAAGVSAVTELVTDFITYNGADWGFGPANPGRLYRNDSPWTWVSAITVSAAQGSPQTLGVYGGNLYYTQNALLGKYDGTNGNANFQSLTTSNASNPRIIKIMSGSLFVGYDSYVGKYDGTTWKPSALVLPSDFTVKSMETFADRLYIMADNRTYSRIFIWDGTSNTFETFVTLPDESNGPTLKVTAGVLWVVANRGGSTTGSPVYVFDGSTFNKVQTLPIKRNVSNGLTGYAGGLAITSNDGSTAAYEDGVAGVWLMDRHSSEYPLNTILAFPLRKQPTNKTLGGVAQMSNNFYVGAQDITNSTYEIFNLDTNAADTGNTWQTLAIDAGSTEEKMWHTAKLDFETLGGSQTVILKYRLADQSSFTTLKTFTTATTSKSVEIPLLLSSRSIVIRVELTTSSAQTTRLRAITLNYTPTKK